MAIHVELPVRTSADLIAVDMMLRDLHFTSTGRPCQASMTMEYQSWRHEVQKELRQTIVGLRKPARLKAYIQGFSLMYCDNKCVVSQILPMVFDNSSQKERPRKRKADSLDTNSVTPNI